ncbi:MAG: 2-C-methyl-D-erythritol 4-phosphate cytidylyltransferase [Eubacterium sp.]|nr:2-C-methyl-D-erythritol 4-phosphate cytidylyltransferase [Eubacterium sp.]
MNIAVIFAGGIGQRMKSKGLPKQFLSVHSKPIIIHTLEHFQQSGRIDAICISCVPEWIDYLKELIVKYNITKVKDIVPGGETGQMSIVNGLRAADRWAKEQDSSSRHVVLIHDGVRPLINDKLISDCVDSVEKYGSAITSVVVKETVLMVKDSDTNEIDHIPNRSNTRLARAPQCFWLDEILEAEEEEVAKGNINYIDSCSLMQTRGLKMHLVDGPMENIKVTTPDDFYSMRALLDAKENAQIYGED